ncbi:TPA: hypothetical protein PMB55_000724 [Vibrio cholerae]|nr:hypothetical protein [Vibrio cholerae]
MYANFLKKKKVALEGGEIEVTQLSGLERYDFIDYCTSLSRPEIPVMPSEDASREEKEAYLEECQKVAKQFERLTFICRARLVAYGCKAEPNTDIEERHQSVMASFTDEQVKKLHDEIALFSGIPIQSADENAEQEEQGEPVDPKA